MYREYNPNPNNKRVGDCVVRAISKALNQSWEETYIELCLLGYIMGDLPSSNRVWDNYLKTQGFSRHIVTAECLDCYTINDFCNEYPQGTYVIGTGSHAVCIENGVAFDSWNSLDETPIYFYKKEN
jgi:hypothetical protein